MKRLLSWLLALALVLSCVPQLPVQAQTVAEQQSAFDDYTAISSKEELDAVRDDLNGKYYLTADITFTEGDFAEGGAFYNNGAKWLPIGTSSNPFRGVFDGNGHTITGLKISISNTSNVYGGLFGCVNSSSSNNGVYNLGMVDCYIWVSNSTGTSYVGSVAGYCETGTIEGCYNTGYIFASATSGTMYTGGIIGYKQYGTINRCYNLGTVAGAETIGGIVGGTTYAGISNCFAIGDRYGIYAGGISGSSSFGSVENCYTLGDSESTYGTGFAGGIVGMNSNCTVTNCYYTSDTSSGGGTKKTAAAMQNQSTFSGFDFTNTWTMDGNSDYPYPELQGVTLNYTRTLTSISVSTMPVKTEYIQNEDSLDVTGGVITQTYNDGSTSTVAMTIDMVSGFDNTVLGEQTLSVEHEGMSATFVIQIIAPKPKVVHVEITSLPNKLVYIKDVDTNIVTNGGQLTATYDDGSTMIVTIANEMISGVDFTIEGTQNVTIVYEGVTTTYEINILAENTAEFAGGKGTETSPYLISNTTHLSNIKLYPSAHYALTQDIRFTDSEQWDGLETFLGVLDGNGFKIYNLNSKSLVDTNAGKIKNLGCYEVNIANKTSKYLGVIASTNNGEIYRCYVTGNLYSEIKGGSYTSIYIGGIAGYNCGKIIECCSNMNIVGHFISNDEKINYLKRYIGGISGFGYNGNIENCYSLGAINATEQCDNCWWRDNTTYSYEGVSGGGSEVNLSYSDVIINNSHSRAIVGNNGKTVVGTIEELQSKENYVGFDFTSVWVIGMSEYPMPSLRGMTTFGPQAENTTDFLGGNGSQFSPYLISNYSHLCNISKYLNANFLAVCDIVVPKDALNWKPIGTAELPFSGVFDGGGHTISGCIIDATEADGTAIGFFGYATNCEIRNVSFANGSTIAFIDAAEACAGTVVGSIESSIVANCQNFQSISLTTMADSRATGYCGGIVGSAYDTRIIACTNSGIVSSHTSASEYQSVHAYDYVGGIVATGGTIEQCTNMGECSSFVGAYITGSITPYYATMTANAYIGGIAGTASNISDCKNSGVLKSETLKKMTRSDYNDEPEKGSIWCGGIVAEGGTVQRCYNTGSNLVGKCSHGRNAGIAGIASAVEDCFNVGILEYTDEGSGSKAGIAGSADMMTKCYSLYYPVSISKLDVDNNPYCYDYFGYGSTAMVDKDPYAQSTYEGFDFGAVWTMGSGAYPYPVLDDTDIPWELTGIAIESLPIKTKYITNIESLDLSGAKIKLERNGIFTGETLNITPEMVTGFDNTSVGKNTITVTYRTYVVEFVVDIITEDTTNFAGGIGSQEYPYVIKTEAHLRNMSNDVYAYYVISEDITLTDSFQIASFYGALDGNGHKINGISKTLIRHNYGVIKDLGLYGSISESKIDYIYLGSFSSYNYGTIERCYSAVTIYAKAQYKFNAGIATEYECLLGGIVAKNSGVISDCYNIGNIQAISEHNYWAYYTYGGAVAAGIAANNTGTITNCYNIGELSAEACEHSGIRLYGISNVYENSYAIPNDGMLYQSTYNGFDFNSIWYIDPFSGYYYPQLKWQQEAVLTGISIIQNTEQPIETVEGLWPDVSNIIVQATYADGTTTETGLVPALLGELNIAQVSTQTVHLTCGDLISDETVTFVIKAKEPAALEIKKAPAKLTYVLGQPLALDDGVLTLTYSNNTTEDIKLTDVHITYDADAIGTVTVTAAYAGLTTSFDIAVSERTVASVVLTQPSKLSYIEGQDLDLTDGSVSITYVSDDNYTEIIPLDISMVSGYNKDTVGVQIVTFSYLDHSETFAVRVVENKVVSLEISKLPQKLIYDVCKEQLDVTGGKIIVTYLDGSTGEIAMTLDMVDGFDGSVMGIQQLTVCYGGATATFVVEVAAQIPDFVEILTKPDQLSYVVGDTVDPTGLTLKAFFGEEEAIVTAADIFVQADTTTAGIKTATAIFGGKSATFEIYVHDCGDITVDSSLYPESNHSYSNNLNQTKVLTVPGATELVLTFNSSSNTESGYDYVWIYDGDENQIGKYCGSLANKVVTVPGDTVKIKLTTDGSQTYYGYKFASIVAKGVVIHPEVAVPGYGATCTEDGLTDGIRCSICGEMTLEQEVIPALGHNYVNCKCDVCGEISEDAVASVEDIYYSSLDAALTAAGTNGVVKLYKDISVDTLLISSGAALDLNGHNLTATTGVVVFGGQICDSTEGQGAVLTAKNTMMVQSDNAQLPLYDSETGGYRFFSYGITEKGVRVNGYGSICFGFGMTFGSQDGYRLLRDSENAGVTMLITLDCDGFDVSRSYQLTGELISRYAELALKYGDMAAFMLTVKGVENLPSGTSMTAISSVSSERGVGKIGNTISYQIP